MNRIVRVAAAQMGPVARHETRAEVVERLVALLREAATRDAQLVVFPELALTTFFPRWDLPDDEVLTFFEREMPGPDTKPLFEDAARLGIGFHLGYAELTPDGHRYNTAILVAYNTSQHPSTSEFPAPRFTTFPNISFRESLPRPY